ncbi:YiiX/YebB-like N1pC/P60 family cysteine hydrolase [Herbivorax sp. ANBcel31]|uniref:YiiX/YebB-like N1pC/P60 family cysteine hydrolase n=1 Tax=Herbivorax sp. ANBcel31 TaxID=3069754 RepID=UPI0027B6BB74|nr:YiiX/YebB-like N1pC/P60 family cysteine hydrolase [Herbivorax sp. ANBcel31]MDQ2087531.1 YiiX/YebB-like N1pC/P60 family cysteine hydrolase [Herbivorax sp. ANBcel31]
MKGNNLSGIIDEQIREKKGEVIGLEYLLSLVQILIFLGIIYFLCKDTYRVFKGYLIHIERKILIAHIVKLLIFLAVTYLLGDRIPYEKIVFFFILILIASFLVVLSIRQVEIEKSKKNGEKIRTFKYNKKFMKYFLYLLVSISNFNELKKRRKFMKIATKEIFYIVVFPAQKYIAVSLTALELTPRKEKFISDKQLIEIKDRIQPGDILLKRNDWQATNFSMPGFWTHTGIYIGTLELMDKYFEDVDDLEGKKFSQVLKECNYKIYKKLSDNDKLTVIESIAEGVSIKELSNIAKVDYFAALRPNVSKEVKMKAILKAGEFVGKPYDYHFNSKSREAFICTELVRKSYANNLNFMYSNKFGKKIIFPNNVALKYSKERKKGNRELDFVLFYDLNIKSKKAFENTEAEFSKSYKRSLAYYRRRDLLRYLRTILD